MTITPNKKGEPPLTYNETPRQSIHQAFSGDTSARAAPLKRTHRKKRIFRSKRVKLDFPEDSIKFLFTML